MKFKAGKRLESSFTVDKVRKPGHLIFLKCFAGPVKARCLFWEKKWSSINLDQHYERIVPPIISKMEENPDFTFMQDGAPYNPVARAIAELSLNGIHPINWPNYSPDLNPIEAVWNQMKDFTKRRCPGKRDREERSFDELNLIFNEAWDSIMPKNFKKLAKSMFRIC